MSEPSFKSSILSPDALATILEGSQRPLYAFTKSLVGDEEQARDILQDVRVEGDAAFERFQGKKQGTLWYYRALVGEFRKAGGNPLVKELDRAVADLERPTAANCYGKIRN